MIDASTPDITQEQMTGVIRIRFAGAVDGDPDIAFASPLIPGGFNVANPVITSVIVTVSPDGFFLTVPLAIDERDPSIPLGALGESIHISGKVLVDGTDVSDFLVQQMSVNWPDEAGGTFNFSLRGQNPYLGGALVTAGSLVNAFAVYREEPSGALHQVRLFKGKVLSFDYNPDKDVLEVQVQDFSHDISRETAKLDQEILTVDPIITEKRTANKDSITVTRNIDLGASNPVIGIWLESDITLDSNIVEQINFQIVGGRTIKAFTTGKIISGRAYVVKYSVPLTGFSVPTFPKSTILAEIAKLANVANILNERAGAVEDEIVGVNIVANQEFPLDIMRKIVVPQTWKIEFNEHGTLIIRREILKATPDHTHDEDTIMQDSFVVSTDTNDVVNCITVAGFLKRLGRSG